jgi:hypothetical protein
MYIYCKEIIVNTEIELGQDQIPAWLYYMVALLNFIVPIKTLFVAHFKHSGFGLWLMLNPNSIDLEHAMSWPYVFALSMCILKYTRFTVNIGSFLHCSIKCRS